MRRSDTASAGGEHAAPGAVAARFRHDRLFLVAGDGWYVETRSGNIGPFSSQAAARRFLATAYPRAEMH